MIITCLAFGKAIHCLCKIGEEIFIETRQHGVSHGRIRMFFWHLVRTLLFVVMWVCVSGKQ